MENGKAFLARKWLPSFEILDIRLNSQLSTKSIQYANTEIQLRRLATIQQLVLSFDAYLDLNVNYLMYLLSFGMCMDENEMKAIFDLTNAYASSGWCIVS